MSKAWSERQTVRLTVNGAAFEREVEPRRLLVDFLREDLGLTGTHAGCEHGVCGACTVLLDGDSARSCLTLAVQADGAQVETVEGLGTVEALHPLQQAFRAHHALQCGFCTPGMLMTALDLLRKHPSPTEREIRDGLSGNLCRCTGYEHIVRAVRAAATEAAAAANEAATSATAAAAAHESGAPAAREAGTAAAVHEAGGAAASAGGPRA